MPLRQNQAAAETLPGPIFIARGLTKVYRSGEVEVRALAGALLNILGGLDRASSGTVTFKGVELTALDDQSSRSIGARMWDSSSSSTT